MLNQQLSQKQIQKLSPQQIQLMKLLQVPTAALEQRIKEEIEVNPALEEADDYGSDDEELFANSPEDMNEPFDGETGETTDYGDDYDPDDNEDPYESLIDNDIDISDYYADFEDDTASYKLNDGSYNNEAEEEDRPVAAAMGMTFHEFLMEQLGLLYLDERQHAIATQIIGSIDDDGYLRRSIDALVDDLAFGQNIDTDEMEVYEILHKIQQFEPDGVGGENLQECLLIQIRKKRKTDDTYILGITEQLLENFFEEFAKKHYDKLMRNLGVSNDDLRDAIDQVLKLNPKPGNAYVQPNQLENYIVPDFILQNNNGELVLSLNAKNAPDLRISDAYKDMLREYSSSQSRSKSQKEAILFIKQKIDSAKWFIDAIKQRQSTMMKTMEAILRYQQTYFLTGDEMQLNPMILKDIAEITGLDISTISRVSNSKYVMTEFGVFKLKDFFSESLQTESGEEVSTREVKKILTDLIENEEKNKPLSDEKLMQHLIDKGYNIARRTVAKYREQLDIPVARLRREL